MWTPITNWDQCLQQQTFPPQYELGPLTEHISLKEATYRPLLPVQTEFKFLTFRKIKKDSFNPEFIISHRFDLCVISDITDPSVPTERPHFSHIYRTNKEKEIISSVPTEMSRCTSSAWFIQRSHLFLIIRVKPTLQLSLFMIQPENINKTIKMKKQIFCLFLKR